MVWCGLVCYGMIVCGVVERTIWYCVVCCDMVLYGQGMIVSGIVKE